MSAGPTDVRLTHCRCFPSVSPPPYLRYRPLPPLPLPPSHLVGSRRGGGLQVGTLLVVDGTSTEEVTAWAATDPYAAAGLFESVRVWPMKKVVEEGKVLV